MSSLNIGFRRAVLPPAVLLLLAAACHRQPGAAAPAPVARDSVQVGYGTEARRDVTGAVSQVNTAGHHATATSMADLLEGRVPGLDVTRLPNGGVSLRIRGDRTFLGSNEPLIVVDGTPVIDSNALLQDMDPRDVASISVLKDAGSLAAYGSRGANGVILITTKKQ